MHSGKYVAYYRVSTDRQGKSGLGLEAQEQTVRDRLNGGDWSLVGQVTEVETGTNKTRESPRILPGDGCQAHRRQCLSADP